MGTFLIIILVIFLLWPWISKWVSRFLQRYMAQRAEDMMRRMMGMPTRKEEERARQRAERESRRGGGAGSKGKSESERHHRPAQADAAAMLNSVAEDVEYTEIREFDSTTIASGGEDGKTRVEYHEEQVTDAEYVEIKTKRS